MDRAHFNSQTEKGSLLRVLQFLHLSSNKTKHLTLGENKDIENL